MNDEPVEYPSGQPAAPAGDVRYCTECGAALPPDEFLQLGNALVCPKCKPLFVQRLRETGGALNQVRYGGFWIRVGARIIDTVLLSVLALALGVLVVAPNVSQPPDLMRLLAAEAVLIVVNTIISATYEITLTATKGGTLGKLALGLQVVTPDGKRLTWGRAAGRYFAQLVSGFTFGIGYVIAAFDEQKRALHDHIASTRVIRA